MDSRNVGMIGLGLMGTAFTERLLESGYSVCVHNRTREKADPLVALGARWSDNPLAVCQRVIISLYTTDTVETVLEQLADGLRPGQVLIDTTTGNPADAESSRQIADPRSRESVHRVAQRGVVRAAGLVEVVIGPDYRVSEQPGVLP